MTPYGEHTHEEFTIALEAFIAGAQKIKDDHREQFFSDTPRVMLEPMPGDKRVRIVEVAPGQRSCFCFVDMATGDVLKSAGWAKPAKHARGNIYAEDKGLSKMGPYGPAYLR
jgi:hypothetical protein